MMSYIERINVIFRLMFTLAVNVLPANRGRVDLYLHIVWKQVYTLTSAFWCDSDALFWNLYPIIPGHHEEIHVSSSAHEGESNEMKDQEAVALAVKRKSTDISRVVSVHELMTEEPATVKSTAHIRDKLLTNHDAQIDDSKEVAASVKHEETPHLRTEIWAASCAQSDEQNAQGKDYRSSSFCLRLK